MSATVAEFDRAVRLLDAMADPSVLDAIDARLAMLKALLQSQAAPGASRFAFNGVDLAHIQTALDYARLIKRDVPADILRTAALLGLAIDLPAWFSRSRGEAAA